MTALPPPACPTCRAELTLGSDESFNAWVCPAGHGLAFTLSEAYERLRDDEIHAIWHRARADDVPTSARRCPMCAGAMVAVPCESVTLDVCVVDEVLWFDAGELEQLPTDTPAVAPTAEEQAELAEITESFGDSLTAGWEAVDDATVTGRLSRHLLRARHASTAT